MTVIKTRSIKFFIIFNEYFPERRQNQEDFDNRFASFAIEWKIEFESERSAFGVENSAISPPFITITRL